MSSAPRDKDAKTGGGSTVTTREALQGEAFLHEVEIKLQLLSEKDWEAVWSLAPHHKAPVVQENTFYDTQARELERAGWRFRVRRQWRWTAPEQKGGFQNLLRSEGSTFKPEFVKRGPLDSVVLTLKGRSRQEGSAAIRPEIEKILEPEQWRRLFSPGVPVGEVWDWGAQVSVLKPNALEELVLLGSFENTRATLEVPLRFGARIIELDRTVFTDGQVDHEVEMELTPPVESETLHNLEADLKAFLRSHGVAYGASPGGKFTRALKHRALGSSEA